MAEKRRQEAERRLAEERRKEEERKLEEERERQKAEEVAAFLAGQQVGEEIAKDGLELGPDQTEMESGQTVALSASDPITVATNVTFDSNERFDQEMQAHATSDDATPTDSPTHSTWESRPSDDTERTATDPNLAQVLPPVYIPPAQTTSPYQPTTPPTSRPGYGTQLSQPQLPSALASRSYDSIFQTPAGSNHTQFQHQQSHPLPYGAEYYQQPPYGYGGAPLPPPQDPYGYQPGVQQYQQEGEEYLLLYVRFFSNNWNSRCWVVLLLYSGTSLLWTRWGCIKCPV